MKDKTKIEIREKKMNTIKKEISGHVFLIGFIIPIFIFVLLILILYFTTFPYSSGESVLRHLFDSIIK